MSAPSLNDVRVRAQRAANTARQEMFVWTECGEPYPGEERHYFREWPPVDCKYETISPKTGKEGKP